MITEKHKNDEGPRHWGWSFRLKFILGVVIVGLIFFSVWVFVLHEGLGLSGIQEFPSEETYKKIDVMLEARTNSGAYEFNVPGFVSVSSGGWTETSICAAIDMTVLKDYKPDDLFAWSEMSFNEHRLPADQVSIAIRESSDELTRLSSIALPALEICFKRGVRPYTGQKHLLQIFVRDTPDHEILSYEWVYATCACR